MAYLYLLKQLWLYAETHRWRIVLFFILHSCAWICTLFMPYIFAKILNAIQTEPREQLLDIVIYWSIIWVASHLGFNLFHRIARYFEFSAGFRAKQNFLNRHYHIILNLPIQWHTDHHSGNTINRINTAARSLEEFCCTHFIYTSYLISFFGPLIFLYTLSWQISCVAFAIAIISMLIMRQFDKKLIVLYHALNEFRHRISSTFFDYVSNIRTIITLRVGEMTAREYNHKIEDMYKPRIVAETWVNAWKWFFVSLTTMTLKIGVVFYYIFQLIKRDDKIMIGNTAAVFQYLTILSDTFMNIAREYQRIVSGKTDFEASLPIMEAYQRQHVVALPMPKTWKYIAIQNLDFSYTGKKKILDNFDFHFAKGETIALIGESGSGKSTLLNMMRGLYTPQQAKMNIDDQDFDNLSPLYATTTLVPQDPEIFDNTMLFNITLGAEFPQKLVDHVIEMSQLQDVLKKLPDGLQTDMREKGVTLSGGEKQRLALARGLLAAQSSDILLMDEPTSSVDMRNEKLIYQNIFHAFPDKTIISSIHRINLLPLFNRVVMIDQGRVIETGSYKDLKANEHSHLSHYMKKLNH